MTKPKSVTVNIVDDKRHTENLSERVRTATFGHSGKIRITSPLFEQPLTTTFRTPKEDAKWKTSSME